MASLTITKHRWLPLIAALVGMILVLACSGSDSPSNVQGDLAPPEQQVLRLRLTGEPKTIDPHLTSTTSETTLTKPLFGGLFTYNEDLKVIPNLATEMPTIDNGGLSRDGMTYTIKIDKDAKWSDGKAVTAQDFVYSLQRALDPKLAGPYTSFFYRVAGAREYNTALGTAAAPKTPSDAELEALRSKVGISARDEKTVVYTLNQPDPSFLNILAIWTAFPVRQDIVEKFGNKWTEAGNHISNGPFVLAEWSHDQRIVFQPNPYWAGEKPKLTRIEVNFIADDAAAYAAYLADELDAVVVPPAVRRDVSNPSSPLFPEFRRTPELSTYAFMWNNKVAPFDNVKVRQAFGMAIDREAYVEGVLQGAGAPTTTWIPPGMPGYNPELGKQYEFNPTRAKQLLAEAGYPEGRGLPPVTFIAVANDSNRLVGQFVEDQLRRNLGVTVTTEYLPSAAYSARFTSNEHQVTIQRWGADWPYPDNWLPEIFGTGSLNNHVVYANPKFDDIVKRAAAEPDDKKRLALYDEAQKLILDDAALVPIYNRETYLMVKPRVKDLIVTPLDGGIKGDYNFHKTWIAK